VLGDGAPSGSSETVSSSLSVKRAAGSEGAKRAASASRPNAEGRRGPAGVGDAADPGGGAHTHSGSSGATCFFMVSRTRQYADTTSWSN
jgi:hypothetical protein